MQASIPSMKGLLSRRAVWALFAAWVAAMSAFTFADLALSRAVVDFDSGFGRAIALGGELPGALVICVALVAAAAATPWRRRVRDVALKAGLGLVGAYAVLYAVALALRATGQGWGLLEAWGGVFMLGGAALVLGSGAWWRRQRLPSANTARFAWVTIALGITLILGVVLVMKVLWGRPRPEELGIGGVGFSYWFEIHGPNGHVSFPSGHTALGWMVAPALLLVADAPARIRRALAAVVVAWGVAVAVGRVRYGAHFATDVIFSTGAAWALLLGLDAGYRRWVAPRLHRRDVTGDANAA